MKKITRNDVFWGYLAQGLNVGAGVLLLPILLLSLPPADVAIWLVFMTLGGLAQLLEFGFQPTLARNFAYIFSGATSLKSEGLPTVSPQAISINVDLLKNLILSSQKIYKRVAATSCIVLVVFGTLYIKSVLIQEQDKNAILVGWVLFALGIVFNFYFGYVNSLLMGRGDVTEANKVSALNKALFLTVGTALVIHDLGLIGLGLASLIAAIGSRLYGIWLLRLDPITESALRLPTPKGSNVLLEVVWPNAKKIAAVQLCAFLVIRANILIGTFFLGPELIAEYSLTLTVLLTLSTVSSVFIQLQLPYITSRQLVKDYDEVRLAYLKIVVSSLCVYTFGSIAIGLLGPLVLTALGSEVLILPAREYFLLSFIVLLELNHVIAATYITSLNQIPFLRSAVLTAIASVGLSSALVGPYGVFGLIIAQGAVQLSYNNWKWPLFAIRTFRR